MKSAFFEKLHLNKSNIKRLDVVNKIVDEYKEQGYILTLRQLYYQLVSRDIISNNQREYSKLSNLLVQGRMSGIVDWESIEDRIRKPKLPYWVTGIPDAVNDIVEQYRLDRQEGQENYIELWVEKDALSNVLYRITSHYHIRLMVNRGYSSCTALYEAYNRIYDAMQNEQNCYILYLGDHDPSGLDMIKDIGRRLNNEFGLGCNGNPVEIVHIGLTDEQIKTYNPPPNPTKITDTRAKDYMIKYGNTCWEVDALKPEILTNIVKNKIEELIDIELFEEIIEREKEDVKKLKEFAKKL